MIKTFDSYLNRVSVGVALQAPVLAKYGLTGIGVTREMLKDAHAAREANKCARDYGLTWHCIHPSSDLLSEKTDDAAFKKALDQLKRDCELASMIGVRLCYNRVWSGSDQREYDRNFDWNVSRVRRIQRATGEFGVRYALECIGPRRVMESFRYPFLNSLIGVMAIADAADREVGLIFDTFHWYCGGGKIDDVYYLAANIGRLAGFHINDAAPVPIDRQEDKVRALPLQNGVIDARVPYEILKRAGYKGFLMTEPFTPTVDRYRDMPLDDVVREIAEATNRVTGDTDIGG